MVNKVAHPRPTPLSKSLAICLACTLILSTAQAQGNESACSDNPPNADFTCAEQKKLGKCNRDWMIEGNFCQKTCGRCYSSSPSTPPPTPRASLPASVVSTASNGVVEPPAVEEKPVLTIGLEAALEASPATESEPTTAPAPAPQTEPTPAQEQYLEDLANEAAVLSQTTPRENPTPPVREVIVPLSPSREETMPSAITVPRVVPANETRAVQVPPPPKPQCNTTSAWDVLSSDPELSITTRAIEVMNLKNVLQNPAIKFTLFAPTNAAWNGAARAEGQPLTQLLASRNVLRDILFSHIIPNQVLDSKTLIKTPSITPQTSVPIYVVPPQPGSENIGLVSSGSNVRVIQADEGIGCNYALHKINGVLRSSASDTLGVNPTYTRAVAAASGRAGAGP